MKLSSLTALAVITTSAISATAQTQLNIDTRPGAPIQPTMYGLFFEDINYAADGGLYAEKIKNRSFEFPNPFMGWETFGHIEVNTDGPFERNPHYITLSDPGHGERRTGLTNEGFFGVSFEKDHTYRFSVWAKANPDRNSKIRVELIDPASMGETQVMAQTDIAIDSDQWMKYTATLTPSQTVVKGKLRIFLHSPNPVSLEHISLFPVDTWQGHENGLRKDLAQRLADIHPGLLRFPGGCIVEGTDQASRYQWKNTVGPVENRPLNENRWHFTFPHRFFPDYYQSYGLGFYEYFLLAEEIGAAPLPVLNVGLVCQYQNRNEDAHVPLDSLQPYIDDALDLIEFANADTTTTWGALRASMGHPAPFRLKYLAIGNEQWDPIYPAHLQPFVKAIRAHHPEIKIVGSSGPNSEGKQFDYLWPEMRRLGADLVDEHFYRPESWFLSQGTRYDHYDRKGPKVFAGEYACHGRGKKYNHYNAALLEAAFMTGLERNADVVHMATYAPLFAHIEGWQWRPDMIWFDNLRSMPTASYYVQQLYATHKGTHALHTSTDSGEPLAGLDGQNGLFASAVVDNTNGTYIVKIANTSDTPQQIDINLKGLKKKQNIAAIRRITLKSPDGNPMAENTLDNPSFIRPVERTMSVPALAQKLAVEVPAKTFEVYLINLNAAR